MKQTREREIEKMGYRAAKAGEPWSKYPTYTSRDASRDVREAFMRGYMKGCKEI